MNYLYSFRIIFLLVNNHHQYHCYYILISHIIWSSYWWVLMVFVQGWFWLWHPCASGPGLISPLMMTPSPAKTTGFHELPTPIKFIYLWKMNSTGSASVPSPRRSRGWFMSTLQLSRIVPGDAGEGTLPVQCSVGMEQMCDTEWALWRITWALNTVHCWGQPVRVLCTVGYCSAHTFVGIFEYSWCSKADKIDLVLHHYH